MPRLLKTHVQERTNRIKALILSDGAFEEPLARLYLDLALQGKHSWTLQTYRLLCLYVGDGKEYKLYHPTLLQACLSVGNMELAQTIAQYLHKQNPSEPETLKLIQALQTRTQSTLPAYTPLAALSKHAQKTTKRNSSRHTLPGQWARILPTITPEKLEAIGYYTQRKKLLRAPRFYRDFLLTHFDEMILNYLFQHNRCVVVLAGALLELLLAVHLQEKLHITRFTIRKQAKYVFDLNLSELLIICTQKNLLPANALRLCQAARMQRNFIHPGKEILEHTRLSLTGARICFLAVLEVIDTLL